MIISQTPLRVSFFGGGTDLPAHYRVHGGAVLSTTIDKHCYITVNRRFDHTLRVSYSHTETVETVDELRHPLVREAMRVTGVDRGIELTSIADIPAGTGMGSSSTFTVGVLTALYAFAGRHVGADELARRACEIEIDRVGEPIGKQDQYAAAFGGLNVIRFLPDERVTVDPVLAPAGVLDELDASLLLFYTGVRRAASTILADQQARTASLADPLRRMAALVDDGVAVLASGRDLPRFGALLHEGWELKRALSARISAPEIDDAYSAARTAGALGGKLLGAGGGGFLLLYVERHNQERVRRALSGLREIPFHLSRRGSHVIFVSG